MNILEKTLQRAFGNYNLKPMSEATKEELQDLAADYIVELEESLGRLECELGCLRSRINLLVFNIKEDVLCDDEIVLELEDTIKNLEENLNVSSFIRTF